QEGRRMNWVLVTAVAGSAILTALSTAIGAENSCDQHCHSAAKHSTVPLSRLKPQVKTWLDQAPNLDTASAKTKRTAGRNPASEASVLGFTVESKAGCVPKTYWGPRC